MLYLTVFANPARFTVPRFTAKFAGENDLAAVQAGVVRMLRELLQQQGSLWGPF